MTDEGARGGAGARRLALAAAIGTLVVLAFLARGLGGPGRAPDPGAAAPPGEAAVPGGERADPGRNLLENPGFERGRAGWRHFEDNPNWGDFEVVTAAARSGSAAARLPVRWSAEGAGPETRVFGVYQEIRPERFPAVVSGWYRVDGWRKDSEATDLYVQVVIMAWGDPRTMELVSPGKPIPGLRNYQVRYYLAGVSQPPFLLGNARVKFVKKGPPEIGRWVYFELPVRQDFLELWGVVPENYDSLRVLFEARWDNKPPHSGLRADVYYDDLYVGDVPP